MGTYGEKVSDDPIRERILGAASRYTQASRLIDQTLEERRVDSEISRIFGEFQQHATPKKVLMSSPIDPNDPKSEVQATEVTVPPSPTEVYEAAVRSVSQLVPLGEKGAKTAEEITRQVENYDRLFPEKKETKAAERKRNTATVLNKKGVPEVFPSNGREYTATAEFYEDDGSEIPATRKFSVLGERGGSSKDKGPKLYADYFVYKKEPDGSMVATNIRTTPEGTPSLTDEERLDARKQFQAEDASISDDLRTTQGKLLEIQSGLFDPDDPSQVQRLRDLEAEEADLKKRRKVVRSRLQVLEEGAEGTVPEPKGYGDKKAKGRLGS